MLTAALIAIFLLPGAMASGEDTFYPHPVLYWVDWVGAELAFATQEAAGSTAAPPSASAELLLVREELAALRHEVAELRATTDEYLGGVIAALQRENETLRQDLVRAQYANRDGAGYAPSAVPRPAESYAAPAPAPTPPPPAPADPENPPPYEVVKEWGRTPEVAAELGSGVSALKGMVLVIPPGTPSRAVEELGRALRREFDVYENINIDVFADAEAAAAFIEGPTPKPRGRVLSIARQADSGLDTILITENGVTMDVPR